MNKKEAIREDNAATEEKKSLTPARREDKLWQRVGNGVTSIMHLEVLLFLLLWFAYGVAVNSDNQFRFNLPHIGVEAMVERHQFYLEGSRVPELQPFGDVFLYQGHKYAAKQPGEAMAGAVAYFALHAAGLRYSENYFLTSALVTFLTTSLVLAASAIGVFKIAQILTKDRTSLFWPVLTTFVYALATTVFPYSGIAHHDALATGYLVLAFYFIFQVSGQGRPYGRGAILMSAAAGYLLGLTVMTSMLPFFMVLVCAIYFLSLRRWKLVPLFLTAMLFGLAPLFVYDARSFGNPFLLPNVVGADQFPDTFFHFDAKNLGEKLVFYSSMVIVYVPVCAIGLFGLTYYPRVFKRKPAYLTLVALMVVLMVYILNIDTRGHCQFGPRYLLPAMPFACLGVVGYTYLSTKGERWFAGIIVALVSVTSFVINLVGAMQGAMCCPDGQNAFGNQLSQLIRGHLHSFPLAPWLIVPLAICAVLFVMTVARRRDRSLISRDKRRSNFQSRLRAEACGKRPGN
jgi:hypothetical protein